MENSKMVAVPLLENEYVKELLTIMEANDAPGRRDLLAVLTQVGAMERQLNAAVTELTALRRELNAAREQAHPMKTALKNTGAALEKNVADLRDKLSTVKQNAIDGCKNAVDTFKEKGISALDNIARFFKVRPMLEAMRGELSNGIRADRAAMVKIKAMSTEYHEAGRHIKNMGRTLMGKESVSDAKPLGKLAKSLEVPFKAELSCLSAMKRSVETALSRLTALERAAERKPSVQKTIRTLHEQIAQKQESVPDTEKPRPLSHEAR
ncbi:MAG: hypothetical protein EOM54_14585 [Clostridia bacterium]|nr:hypothetical protein [Clostridia bacterium]